jgi:hypothetical protein
MEEIQQTKEPSDMIKKIERCIKRFKNWKSKESNHGAKVTQPPKNNFVI